MQLHKRKATVRAAWLKTPFGSSMVSTLALRLRLSPARLFRAIPQLDLRLQADLAACTRSSPVRLLPSDKVRSDPTTSDDEARLQHRIASDEAVLPTIRTYATLAERGRCRCGPPMTMQRRNRFLLHQYASVMSRCRRERCRRPLWPLQSLNSYSGKRTSWLARRQGALTSLSRACIAHHRTERHPTLSRDHRLPTAACDAANETALSLRHRSRFSSRRPARTFHELKQETTWIVYEQRRAIKMMRWTNSSKTSCVTLNRYQLTVIRGAFGRCDRPHRAHPFATLGLARLTMHSYRIEPSYAEESTPPARQPIPQPRQRLNRSSSVSPYGLRHQLEYGMAQRCVLVSMCGSSRLHTVLNTLQCYSISLWRTKACG